MVDVSKKPIGVRSARAEARISLGSEARAALREATLRKGDAFAVAKLAGIAAAKRTHDLIPLAHPVALTHVEITFRWDGEMLVVEASARACDRTGVEMEAMTAAGVAALALYDMLKSVDREIVIERVRLLEKRGGRSGTWTVPA